MFCRAVEENDPDDLIVYRGDHNFVILNKYPYSTGHLMVVPYAHVSLPDGLSRDASKEMWSFMLRARMALEKCFSPDGFNMGMNLGAAAGAGIKDHVHLHIVPRWRGDANFMAVTGDTRVMSYDIKEVTRLLREEWTK